MTTNGTTKPRGRRSPLPNIGRRLDKYCDSRTHLMTSKEYSLMLDVAGQLMEQPFHWEKLSGCVEAIQHVAVQHNGDEHLQRMADQARRWLDDMPILSANAAHQHVDWNRDVQEFIKARDAAAVKAYGDYIVADDIDETVKVIIDNDARDVTMEAIVLSIRATLDSPLPGGWKKIVRLASIGQRLANH